MSEPVLITTRTEIRIVAERWKQQYAPGWMQLIGDVSSLDIYNRLAALDVESATAADVNAIVGGWITISCDACDEVVEEAVQVGQEPDYESNTATLCRTCCAAAFALFPANEEHPERALAIAVDRSRSSPQAVAAVDVTSSIMKATSGEVSP